MARLRLIALLLLVAAVAASCTGDRRSPEPTPEPTPDPTPSGEVLRFGYPSEPSTLDPLAPGGAAAATRDILRPVLPALFRLDEHLEPQPELAAAWPAPTAIALDPFTVTLDLRDASWSDGRPITANDVRFTWSKLKDGPTKWRYRYLRDVEVVSATTFRLRFDRPFRRWWSLFSIDDMVLPQHAYSDAWKDGPTVSGGPFVFDSWTRGLRVRLVRNPRFGAVVPLAGIDVLFVGSDETRLQLLQRGEIDLFTSEGESNMANRARAYGFEDSTSAAWGPTWWELDLDPSRIGVTVAKAVVEAASSDLAAEILEDSGRPMEGIPPDFTATRKTAEPWKGRGRLDIAKKVLDDGGVRTGAERAEFQLAYASGGAAGALATYLHFRLREIGITAELVGVEPETFERGYVVERRAPAVLRLRRAADAPDAGAYSAASLQPGSAAVDDQVVDAETEVDPARLKAEPIVGLSGAPWASAQRTLVDASTAAPLARVLSVLVSSATVSGPRALGAANGPMWNTADWRLDP